MNFLKEFKIGSFAIHEGSLYLSLKNKNIESKFVILKVDNFKEDTKAKVKLSLWKEIELPVNYSAELSNIALMGDSLFLTAKSESTEQKQMNYAFELDLISDKIQLINSWGDRVIQRLQYDSKAKTMTIVLNSKEGGK